uniref:F-box protein 47 n=1 Tax=Kryptolebias marmoratus TaxID=37003 RepID=A0A3Q2ZEP7_KRYMA
MTMVRDSWTGKSQRLKKTPQRSHLNVDELNPLMNLGLSVCFSVLDISVFSMVSKEITSHVVDYISSLAWKNKTIIQSFHSSTCLEQRSTVEHYRHLGLLFKRCTLLLPTKERLKFIFSKFSKVRKAQDRAECCHCFDTLIAGWDELECQRVFNFLCELTNLMQKAEAVLKTKPGAKEYQEMQLRLFCRQVLLDPWRNQPDCQFWLVQLLKPWPIVSQAHLLLILYGPLLPEGFLGWQNLVETVLPHSSLWNLAKGILTLFGKLEVKGWTTDSMLLTVALSCSSPVIPQPWHVENVARLLVLCGSSLCYTILANKAVNGRLTEVSRLIIYIILVCERDGYPMSWAVKLVQQICRLFSSAPEKLSFIQQLENKFAEITREFFESFLAGDFGETFQTLSVLLDSNVHFHTMFLHMFLK